MKTVPPLTFTYKNWRGEIGVRRVLPRQVYFGNTNYHTQPQWLMEAFDLDKLEVRIFAISEITLIKNEE